MESERTDSRRRPGSRLAVVTAVAVLAAGGGGAYWASTHPSGDGTTRASGAPGAGLDLPDGSVRSKYVLPQQAVDSAYVRSAARSASPTPNDSTATGTQLMDIQSYTTSGKALTVRFWGGVCNTYSASADESATEVTVLVTGAPNDPDGVCPMIVKQFTETVTLDKPLGDRKVVDGADGETVPRGR